MGKDKGLAEFKGKPLVSHVIDACLKMTSNILISTNNEMYSSFGYPLVFDNYIDMGPIGGLEAALSASTASDHILCPCDMPSVSSAIFELLLKKSKGNHAVVVISDAGRLFPVLGYYNKSALPVVREMIGKGEYRMQSLCRNLHAETVVVSSELLPANMNYPKDLV